MQRALIGAVVVVAIGSVLYRTGLLAAFIEGFTDSYNEGV